MSRNLDSSLAAGLSANLIQPVILAALTFTSGVVYVWSGVGNLVFNGNTYVGVGTLGSISAITEGSEVKADGMTIKLSGIGLSPYDIAAPVVPTGVVPPVAVPTGQNMVWALPTENASGAVGNGNGAASSNSGCALSMNNGDPLNLASNAFAQWYGFKLPQLPDDAVIQSIVPVLQGEYTSGSSVQLIGGTNVNASYGFSPGGQTLLFDSATGQFQSTSVAIGTNLSEVSIGALLWTTEPNIDPLDELFTAWFVGCAVYYTTETNTVSIVNDAINDYALGAPAKVYFGLMSNGALIGTPYLVFSGQMDQPTIDMNTQNPTITIALENKLSNLSRPTARRYTAADQHLKYPDDTGFSWVEILNDLALRWGTN